MAAGLKRLKSVAVVACVASLQAFTVFDVTLATEVTMAVSANLKCVLMLGVLWGLAWDADTRKRRHWVDRFGRRP